MHDGGERLPLSGGEVNWSGGLNFVAEDGLLKVSKNARPGTKGKLRVSVKLGKRLMLAACEVKIVTDLKTGYMTGRVWVKYHHAIVPGPSDPIMAVVHLKGPGIEKRAVCYGGDKYRFDGLVEGKYTIKIESIKLPKLPAGYFSSPKQGFDTTWFEMPNKLYGGKEVWHVGRSLDWQIRCKPPTEYRLYGSVTHKGEPVAGVTLTLRNRGNSDNTSVTTDLHGYYTIDSRTLAAGKYWVSALKMVGQDSHYADDNDLLDPGARPEVNQPLTVSFPLSVTGQKLDIECLTRKELFSKNQH
jgi:hypothetical protein